MSVAAPMMLPTSPPRPPESDVPPSATEAKVSSRNGVPPFGLPLAVCAVSMKPAMPYTMPAPRKTRKRVRTTDTPDSAAEFSSLPTV